ncbi:MAG: hypothetical protein K2P14_11350 [Anaeroplasmataceae bacterium]|nr:hypothetical protein [Anaeroplasmataceae bacterium]
MKDFKEMTEDELKEGFIQYFGKETWEELETLDFLQEIIENICGEYLNVEPIPVVFEKTKGCVSVLDLKLECIRVNPKYKENKTQLVAAILHELRHYYQLCYMSNYDTPKAQRWKKEFLNYISCDKPYRNVIQEIELDAESFAEVILECEYGITYRNPEPTVQLAIEEYIKSGRLLEE